MVVVDMVVLPTVQDIRTEVYETRRRSCSSLCRVELVEEDAEDG